MRPTSFGKRIGNLRGQQHLSCRALAAKAGISASTISRVERGMEPEFKHVIAIAKGLGVSTRHLLLHVNLERDLEIWIEGKALPQK